MRKRCFSCSIFISLHPKMSNDSFEFKQFIVHQERCAMKVGTDGTLLGAWADLQVDEGRVLDIGTGTGLIALMMAQRFPKCYVTAVDIDGDAVNQASDNVASSPFSDRIKVIQSDISYYEDAESFDTIVTNPPYFRMSLQCPDKQRTIARHSDTLSYANLMRSAWRLLKDEGQFSLIIPDDCKSELLSEAFLVGFFMAKEFAIRTTTMKKSPKRFLLEFRKYPVNEIIKKEVSLIDFSNLRTQWYQTLTNDFYIK